jgi:hypothetical protein
MSTAGFLILGVFLLIFTGLETTLKIMGIILGFVIMGWWFLLVLLILWLFF